MEGIRRGSTMRRGIGQGIDDLQLLDDRTGPPVRDDHRQRILVLGTNVNEMNVELIDSGDEVRQRVQFRLALAPIVLRRPVVREFLNRREPYALRVIPDRFALGPSRRGNAPAQIGQVGARKFCSKRTNGGLVGHAVLPLSW